MDIAAALDALAREDEAAFDAAAALLADGGANDPVLVEALTAAVSWLWRYGWQPADVVRIAARELIPWHARTVTDLIALEMRSYAEDTVDERWRDQLAVLEAAVWWEGGYLQARQAQEGVGRLLTFARALELLGLLKGLPRLEQLWPPPGTARPMASSHAVAEKTLVRVRALLAKAESTDYEAEAETFTAAAQRLMAKYSIDNAMLAAQPGGDGAARPSGIRVGIDAPYEHPKAVLLNVIADANRCRAIWSQELGFATVLGFGADLAGVELLFTSLLVQAQTALVRTGTKKHGGGKSRSKTFRQSFLSAFASRIGERLAETVSEEIASRGTDLVPVLAALEQEVEQAVERMFPNLTSRPIRSAWDREGWTAGRSAADEASLSA